MFKELKYLFGPRVPPEEWHGHRGRYLLPAAFMAIAAILLVISIFLPYWKLTLHAPQYPDDLTSEIYVNRAEGDITEIDNLNHYIGMRSLADAAALERFMSIFAISMIALLTIAAVYVHSPWAAILTLPALLYPAVFLADLYFWLWSYGTNLDPTAPLSSSIKPFVPPIIGEGFVGNFRTVAELQIGFWFAALASLFILVGIYLHRRAFKPLVEKEMQ